MPMHPTRAMLPALGLILACGGPARADTQPTPEQAHALEVQITRWLASATAGAITLPPRPVQLAPEGDHYLVRIPLAPLGKVEPADAAFTGKARQLDGTRWSLDDQQFPPNLTISTTETVPDPPDAKNPSADGTHKEDVTYRLKLGQQDVHGVFDTSFATPTTSGGTVASIDIEKEGGAGASLSHLGQTTSQSSTRPVDAGHADILSDVTTAGYSTKTAMPDGTTVSLQADRLHVVSALSALAHGQLVPVIQLGGELAKLVQAHGDDSTDGPTPAQKVKLHAMLEKAHDLLTGGKMDQSIEGVKFDVAGNTGTLAKAELTFGADAPADTLSASFGITLDGLTIDALPPPLAVYVPTHFAIHPTLSNVNVKALTKMGLDATAPARSGRRRHLPRHGSAVRQGRHHLRLRRDGAGRGRRAPDRHGQVHQHQCQIRHRPGRIQRPWVGRAGVEGSVRPDAATGGSGDHLHEGHRAYHGRPVRLAGEREQREDPGERRRPVGARRIDGKVSGWGGTRDHTRSGGGIAEIIPPWAAGLSRSSRAAFRSTPQR